MNETLSYRSYWLLALKPHLWALTSNSYIAETREALILTHYVEFGEVKKVLHTITTLYSAGKFTMGKI